MVTDAQKRATNKYQKDKMEELRFRVKKETAQEYRDLAAKRGKSFRAYVIDLIEADKTKD